MRNEKIGLVILATILVYAIMSVSYVSAVGYDYAQNRTPTQQIPSQMNREPTDLVKKLNETGNTNFMAQLIYQTGLDRFLEQDGPYTIFVPNDNAIRGLPQNIVDKLDGNQANIQRVLQNHIVKDRISLTNTDKSYKTLDGMDLKIEQRGNNYYVNGQKIDKIVKYKTGVAYVIDGTIMPMDIVQ